MIKSEIGSIVHSLFHDKCGRNVLRGKDRMKLQKELSNLINCNDLAEIDLTPGIYNQDGTLAEIPPRYEDEYILTK